jgi:hypothetical protein
VIVFSFPARSAEIRPAPNFKEFVMRVSLCVTWAAALLLLADRAGAQTPVDATDRDLLPTIYAEAGPDDAGRDRQPVSL